MINLMPKDQKDRFSYARRNTLLRKWLAASLVGIVGIVVVLAAGQFFIHRSAAFWEDQVNDTRAALGAQKLDETQKHVTDISDSIKLVLQVLAKEILFSKLLSQIGAAMPQGTLLQSLSINSSQAGIDLTAGATSYQTGTQIQINLSDPSNKIFESADIVTINCTGEPTSEEPYPCSVTIRALFAKDNTFQYINNKVAR
jgi:hypothetical protein